MYLAGTLLCLFVSSPLIASDRFYVDDSTGVITDTETNLEWLCAPDIEIDWLETYVWLVELDHEWRCPAIDELMELYEAGISINTPDPFVLGGIFVWCGNLSNYDSVYCFGFTRDYYMLERIATWRAYEYMSGFRAFAVRYQTD